jgi:hypothetical protein
MQNAIIAISMVGRYDAFLPGATFLTTRPLGVYAALLRRPLTAATSGAVPQSGHVVLASLIAPFQYHRFLHGLHHPSLGIVVTPYLETSYGF